MRITSLKIQNFRGIRKSKITFPLDSRLICLIGAGDSTKSTLLKAIEWVFWPLWNLPVSDADFYCNNVSSPIVIHATFSEFTESFLAEDKFGLYLRRPNAELAEGTDDEPEDGGPVCLTIRLTIDASLEPKWEIVCNRLDPRIISQNDRKQLSVGSIGGDVAKDLTWGKYSVLQKYANAKGVLHEAYTTALRDAAQKADLSKLDNVSSTLSDVGKKYGISFSAEIKNRLLIQGSPFSSAVSLFDGDTPLSQFGMGSQRLLSMGLNIDATAGDALLLIDEVENGLEPYRLRNLINEFRFDHAAAGQILMTTHSPIAVAECTINELMVVHSVNGTTKALFLKGNDPKANVTIQKEVRRNAEAFLSKRLIGGEGKTEIGFIRAFDEYLASTKGFRMACNGVGTADGGGSSTFKCADTLHNCGYDVCILMDSDKDNEDTDKQRMKSIGVPVFDWDKPNALEEQCFSELPMLAIQDVLRLAIDEKGTGLIVAHLDSSSIPYQRNGDDIVLSDLSPEQRSVLGKVAKDNNWYKLIGLGERLGSVVFQYWNELSPESRIKTVVTSLSNWVIQNDKAGI